MLDTDRSSFLTVFPLCYSTNPALDVGQVEGAFVMGLGYWMTEQCRYDPKTGALVTDSTWVYITATSLKKKLNTKTTLLLEPQLSFRFSQFCL